MFTEAQVTRMRRLLVDASTAHPPDTPRGFIVPGNPIINGPLRKRALVKHVQLGAQRYGMQDDVDAYLAAAGCASLAGLEPAQLQAIADWVGDRMDRMSMLCDCPDAPPAR